MGIFDNPTVHTAPIPEQFMSGQSRTSTESAQQTGSLDSPKMLFRCEAQKKSVP